MTKQETLQNLIDLKGYIETEAFQEFIVKAVDKELEKLKASYDCNTLEELAEVKGKKEGLELLRKILKQVNVDLKNTKFDLEDSQGA